jgi:hypothetical protein
MKLEVLEFLERRLADLIEKPLEAFFPGMRADQLLAKRLVAAMSDDLSVDAGGQLVAPVYYELRLNPLHDVLWMERPGLAVHLSAALQQAAREQKVAFEMPPVIGVVFDPDVAVEDIQVATLELSKQPDSTTESPAALSNRSVIPPDAFMIINGGPHLALDKPAMTIGRSPTNQLVLDDPQVSRVHAQLRAVDGSFQIIDLDSTCGTLVNGKPVTQITLRDGDVIVLGNSTLIYGQESNPAEETTLLPVIKTQKKVKVNKRNSK